jgi:ADP-heptose:LPS heptosyltransferase
MTGEPRDERVTGVRRIAVLRPNHRLGNALLLTPLIQELEMRFPGAQIELVSGCAQAPSLFKGYPHVSVAHVFPTIAGHPLRVLSLLAALQRLSFDLAIDPIPRSRTGRFLLERVQARERVGFQWFEPRHDRILTHAANPRTAPAHFAHWPLYLLRTAYFGESPGSTELPGAAVPLDLRLTEAERAEGVRRLAAALGGPGAPARLSPVGLFSNATGSKGYPAQWWRQLVSSLRCLAPGVPLVEFIPADRRPRLAGEVPGVYTPDLRLLGATLAATSLVVLADGGVLHLAEAAGAQVLALFRTTHPSKYGPRRARSEALLASETSAAAVAERIHALLQARGTAGAEAAVG